LDLPGLSLRSKLRRLTHAFPASFSPIRFLLLPSVRPEPVEGLFEHRGLKDRFDWLNAKGGKKAEGAQQRAF
jgi:hypothetical protein